MNSKIKFASVAAAIAVVLGAVSSAGAATVTLPLGPIHTGDDIGNYFNGGTDSTGEGPGTNLGFGFSSNATAQKAGNSQATGDGKFENNPSGQTEILSFSFSNATSAYINYAAGFSALSFNYSYSNNNPGTTDVHAYLFSGTNGTGTLLDTLTLTPGGTPVACTGRRGRVLHLVVGFDGRQQFWHGRVGPVCDFSHCDDDRVAGDVGGVRRSHRCARAAAGGAVVDDRRLRCSHALCAPPDGLNLDCIAVFAARTGATGPRRFRGCANRKTDPRCLKDVPCATTDLRCSRGLG